MSRAEHDADRMQREFDHFHEALEHSPGERAAFIKARHADDPQLVRRLLDLLAAHERAERDEVKTFARADAIGKPDVDPVPESIGPYRILELLGEGGMGVVYAAEQTEPLRRRVAIKVIKLGMDTREVLARFEAERQALALMDHPGVAKALDAGVTEQGRPYFVMELVKGLPLVEYCSKQRLPLRDRLRLFGAVCAAIQHAHLKGIIHRDLKPSNILVAMQEGRPVPKVIDFGVAKATAARLTERTVFTEQGRLIGTPEYMSPEQAEMSGLDVDTRTDVYSLGVILYQLITGVLPFDPKVLRSEGYVGILRIINEVEPPRPSTRLTELARTSQGRTDDHGTQVRAVRGELDWIVMRAIAKDRTRRYETASALGDDVERYLTDRPVLAGPPSLLYTVQKFAKRHRFIAGMLALAVLSVIVGFTGLTSGLLRARAAEQLAMQRADNAQAAAAFLKRVLFQADPEFGGGTLTLLQVMENAGRLIEKDLGRYPEVEASVRESLGVAYRRRSMFGAAEPHLRRSLEIRRDLFGDDHLKTAPSHIAMAGLRYEHEGNIVDSLMLLDRAYRSYELHGVAGTTVDGWLQLDIGIINLAGDRLGAAERAFEKCRRLLVAGRGQEHPDVSRAVRGLALVALGRGDQDRAERLAREAVGLCEGEGALYIGARAKLVLAQVLLAADRIDEAGGLLAEVGKQFANTVGDPHIRIAERDAVLSRLHLRRGDFALAERVASHCLTTRRKILRDDHWAILEARLLLARCQLGLGQVDDAESALLAIGDAVSRTLGPDHPLTIRVASARRDCAAAAKDASLREIRVERLAGLRSRRAERLRKEGDS